MNVIFLLHLVLFLIILVIPFTNNKRHLEVYTIMIPFIWLHWMTNDDTCALTQLEMALTKKEKHETFFGRLVSPVYKMNEEDANKFWISVMFFLWLFVQWRLGRLEFLKDDLKIIRQSFGKNDRVAR
jgi:hypothetical protein